MRHDTGLSLRQILCLSACLQITSLECLTETEKEFCFPPFWLQQSPCSQLPSASGHCCFLLLAFLISYGRSWWRNLFFSLLFVLFLLQFLDDILTIFPRETQQRVFLCSHLLYMCSRLINTFRSLHRIYRIAWSACGNEWSLQANKSPSLEY